MDIDQAFNELQAECKKPYTAEILGGALDISNLSAGELCAAISTAAYLGRPTMEWAHEFVWQCGGNADEYKRYFGESTGFSGPPEVWIELKLAGYDWETDEKLRFARFGVRFRYVALEDIIRVNNLRLFKLRVSEGWPFTDVHRELMYKLDRPEMILLVYKEIYIGYSTDNDALQCVKHIREKITDKYEMSSMVHGNAHKCLQYYAPNWAGRSEIPELVLEADNVLTLRILRDAGWQITSAIWHSSFEPEYTELFN